MSSPREDANCLNCYIKDTCGIFYYKKYDLETGKPSVDCYGYGKEMTWEDIKNSSWNKTK